MPPFEDELNRLLAHHPLGVYAAGFLFILVLIGWGFVHTGQGSRLPVAQRRKVKEDVVRLMRGEYHGLDCAGIAAKLGVPVRDLRPLLEDLIEDRFLLTEGEGDARVFRLRGLDNY